MKLFCAILLLLGTTLSFANSDRIGEEAIYDITSGNTVGTLKYSIIDFDSENLKYKAETILVAGGREHREVDMIPLDEVMTHERAVMIINYCTQIGGVLESIAVRGRSFNTCKVELSNIMLSSLVPRVAMKNLLKGDGHVWIGDVPVYGVVKAFSSKLNVNLQSMIWNL